MPLSEFELIQRFFTNSGICRADVALGVGDDCAVLKVPVGKELVVSIDTLVEGVHFLQDLDPELLGHKSLAVNLSDLAAMGAEPAWVTLALTLPSVDADWLEAFCRGFSRLAASHNVQLIGGDTTRGPLNISIQAHGFVDTGTALRRDGAQLGDLVYVTGTLGDAGLALHGSGDINLPACIQSRLDCPSPRLTEGRALVGLANAAIDISDGLISDLGHICDASGVGATIYTEDLPCSQAVRDHIESCGDWSLPLSAGDDYELCFTIPPEKQADVEQLARNFECGLTKIGRIEPISGVRCLTARGQQLTQLSRVMSISPLMAEAEMKPRPNWRNPLHLLAFGLGSGGVPKAPGTAGTLAAVPLYLLLSSCSMVVYLVVISMMLIFGIWLCGRVSEDLGVHDHGGIVWDEWVGFLITMVWAPSGWLWLLAGFLLFRLFDIWKPWPINWLDRHLSGGLGIMLDDVLAGIYGLILLQILVHILNGGWLG